MPKFKIVVEDGRGDRWEEEYDKPTNDPMQWAIETVEKFNAGLRGYESPRKVIDVIVLGESEAHTFKKTNLVTIMDPRRGCYDTARCSRCGITAKRIGLGAYIIDPKYRAKKYKKCPGVPWPVKQSPKGKE